MKPWLLLVVLFVTPFVIRINLAREPIDDAYITYRQAVRLWEGKGWAYNEPHKRLHPPEGGVKSNLQSPPPPGEENSNLQAPSPPGEENSNYVPPPKGEAHPNQVIATTTPLWTMLLAPLSSQLPQVGRYLAVFFDCFVPGILFLIALNCGLNRLQSFLVALLYVVCPDVALCAPAGMELPLFQLLLTLSILCYQQSRQIGYCLSLSLLCLLRPEGVVVAFLFLFNEYRHPKAWLRTFLILLPFGAWSVFTTLYYNGGILPTSLKGKWDTYADGVIWDSGRFLELVDYWGSLFFKSLNRNTWQNTPRAITFLALVCTAAFFLYQRRTIAWILPAYSLIYTILAQFVVVPLFSWYYCHPSVGICLGVVAGAFFAIRMIPGGYPQVIRFGKGVCYCLIVFLLIGSAIALQSWPDNKVAWLGRVLIDHEREHGHRICVQAILNDLRDHPPTARTKVLVHDLGLLGFYLPEAYLVDASAIATPHVTPWHRLHPDKEGNFRVSKELIEAEMPDYFVTMAKHGPLLEEDWIWVNRHYERIGAYEGNEWAVPFVAAYKKK